VLFAGQCADNHYLPAVLDGVWISVRQGWRSRPKEVVADKAYNEDFVRHYLRKRGIQALMPEIRLPKGNKPRKKSLITVLTIILTKNEM
jgi:hypothetical protein